MEILQKYEVHIRQNVIKRGSRRIFLLDVTTKVKFKHGTPMPILLSINF